MNLLINYIKLKNYRQYRDITIKFPLPHDKKNFIIIEGSNGAGKTNILNAITWCLYAEELHLDKKNIVLPIINTTSLKENPSSCGVEVEIKMIDNENKKIIFRRTISFYESKDGLPKKVKDVFANSPDGSKFVIQRQIGNDMPIITDPEYIVQQNIPKTLEEYFLFDGERLERYFKEKSGEKIKEEVFKISQLELLEKVINHLNLMEKDLVKTQKNLDPNLEKIEGQLGAYLKSLETLKNDLKKIIEEKNEKGVIEKDLREKLRSVPKVKKIREEIEEIEDDLKGLEKEIKDIENEKLDLLIGFAPTIIANSAINQTLNMIGYEEDMGNVPPKMDKIYLEKILKKGICICGNNISKKNSLSRKKVEDLIKNISEVSKLSSELSDIKSYLNQFIDELGSFDDTRIKIGKYIRNREKEYKDKSKKLKILQTKIKSCNEKQICKWEIELEQTSRMIGELNEKIGNYKNRISGAETKIELLKKSRDEELKKSKKYEKVRNTINFCEESLKIAKNIKNEIMDETRKQIEIITKKEFFNLIWKKKTWKDVRINSDYDISVVHQSGLEGLGSLSRGETQALALAFVGSLSRVSGFNLPMIIDTPLGRISREVKKNIAENLPKILENKQVIILMTDEEYSPAVREKLSNRLVKEYKINFKETEIGSEAWLEKYEK